MGQYWQVIACTPREKLGARGKLGEDLFDGSPSSLVLPLAVPILPKGFGLTQPHDPTFPVLTGEHKPGGDEYLKLSEQEVNMAPMESRTIKRKRDNGLDPTEREQKYPKLPLDDVNVSPVIKDTCGLLRLPKELLDVVFQELDIVQVFVLGLQTRYLWNVALTHIQAYRASSCGPWAGKGIICVGEYLEPADYPPDLLTRIEKEELQKGLDESEIQDVDTSDEGSTDFVSSPTNLYYFADARYQQVREWPDNLANKLLAKVKLLGEWHRLPTSRRTLIRDDLTRHNCPISILKINYGSFEI